MSFLINSFQFGTAIPTGNLVLYNRFNNSLTDETGNHTLTNSGVTYTTGIYSGAANEAALFVRTDPDYLMIPDSDLFTFGNGTTDSPFSFSFGIKTSDSAALARLILIKRGDNGGGTSTVNREWQIQQTTTTGVLGVFLWDQSSGGNIGTLGTTVLNDSVSKHITITYDGNSLNTGIKIYVNGVLETMTPQANGTYTAMENGASNVYVGTLGYDLTTTINSFSGRLDGLGIWDIELSQEEVTAIYNKQASGNELL